MKDNLIEFLRQKCNDLSRVAEGALDLLGGRSAGLVPVDDLCDEFTAIMLRPEPGGDKPEAVKFRATNVESFPSSKNGEALLNAWVRKHAEADPNFRVTNIVPVNDRLLVVYERDL